MGSRADRELVVKLAVQLEISLGQVRRGECDDWIILGRFGSVYCLPAKGFQIVIAGWEIDDAPWTTARGWNICKNDMSFARLTQDGHDEGIFMLDREPTPAEAEKIRKWVGLRKRKHLDEAAMADLRARGAAMHSRATSEAA